MLKAILSGETFRRIIITIIILSMMLAFGTAFVSHGPPTLREIDPYYFDPDMLPSMTDEQMLSLFDMEPQFVADLSMERNELSELTAEELEESMRALREYNLRETTEFVTLLNSGLSYSELTEDNRVFLFKHLDISDAANSITNQLFMTMGRDGFTLPESVELVMIMSGGLFDYVEAQKLLRSALSTQERLMDVLRFEHFAQRFDIVGEVNSRRLVNRSFVSINEFAETGSGRLVDISALLNAERVDIQYSFVEAVQRYEREVASEAKNDFEQRLSTRTEGQLLLDEGFSEFESRRDTANVWAAIEELTREEYVVARATFAAFTNEHAFCEARRMFLNNYSSKEIETAFAFGAALGTEPQTYMLSSDIRSTTSRISSNGSTSVDNLATILFADVIRQNPERGGLDAQVVEVGMSPNHAAFEAMLSALSADIDEVNKILHAGMFIMNLGGASITPMLVTHEDIVGNPFRLNFNVNESVTLNTGAFNFRINVLNLPGRNGFDLNLDLVYTSADADVYRFCHTLHGIGGFHHVFHGLGLGWMFDLPYISYHSMSFPTHVLSVPAMLYIPGRGRFPMNDGRMWGTMQYNILYSHNDMRMFRDNSFWSNQLQSVRRLDFRNGTSYFFHHNLIIGK